MKNNKLQKTGILLTLTIFVIFAVCILFLLLAGANNYEKITRKTNKTYEIRTASQFITTKVRQNDRENAISIYDFEGINALVLKEEIDGTVYNTYIYCYDGYMMEIFAEEDVEISPVDGEKIMPLNKLSFNLDQGMLSIDLLSADDISQSLKIHIRSTKEAEL